MPKTIHFNCSFWPEKNKLPACQIGGDWGRDFAAWKLTIDLRQVTCKRCLKAARHRNDQHYHHPLAVPQRRIRDATNRFLSDR